jgi:hypothetical protein
MFLKLARHLSDYLKRLAQTEPKEKAVSTLKHKRPNFTTSFVAKKRFYYTGICKPLRLVEPT